MNGWYRRGRWYAPGGMLAAATLAGTACAQTAPPFAQLLRETATSPRIAALDADVAQAEGLALQARARPNPTIGVYAENFAGDLVRNARDQQQTTVQIDQPIELGGKRAARIAAGEAGVVAARAQGSVGRIAFAGDLALAYAGVEIADRRLALAEDEIEEATQDLRLAQALVGAGKEARLRQLQAETEANTLQAELETARAHRTAALARLSALAGAETMFTGIAESLLDRADTHGLVGPVDPRDAATVRAATAERDAAAQRVTVERRQAIPNIVAQFGVRQVRVADRPAIVAGVGIPLPLFDRNRGNVAAAQAQLRAAEARVATARLETQAAVRGTASLVEATDRRIAAAARTVGIAGEAYRLARVAYEAGKSPLIEVLSARHSLDVARGAAIDAAAARLEAHVALARLQGRSIVGEILP